MPDWTKGRIAEAKLAAMKLVNEFVIREPRDIRLGEIAAAKDAFVIEEGLQGAEARLTRNGKFGIIRLRGDIPEIGRRRFALGHELGHWLLHAKLSQFEYCTSNEIEGYVNSEPELSASAFAAELLMPTRVFGPRCRYANPDLELIKQLASEFDTTLTATAARFVQESKADCVAVFSENGVVKRWVKRDDKGLRVWFRSRQRIGESAFARYCAADRQVPTRMTAVPPEAWFPEIPAVREVHEHSTKLGNYPTVLTLLWIRHVEGPIEESLEELDPKEFSLGRRRWPRR